MIELCGLDATRGQNTTMTEISEFGSTYLSYLTTVLKTIHRCIE
jgi:hypothetical protein